VAAESCVGGVVVSSFGPLATTKVSRLLPRLSTRGGNVSTELDVMTEISTVNEDGCCPVSRVSAGAILPPWLWERELWINVGPSPSLCPSRRALY